MSSSMGSTSNGTVMDLEKQTGSDVTTLTWNNLTFSVGGREEPIIQGVSGELVSGELLAGKTVSHFHLHFEYID